MKLSADQEAASREMTSGQSLFLTGGAGTGKTALVNRFCQENPGRRIARLATTGAAAQLIGGQTLHSFFHIGREVHRPGDISVGASLRRKVRNYDGFIIEETSMLRVDQMRQIRDILKGSARGYGEFGGYQLICVGDFAQLPPVLTNEEVRPITAMHGPDALFAFQTPSWKALSVHELTTIHRQSGDLEFAQWLGNLRKGKAVDLDLVNDRVGPASPKAVNLVSTNRMANTINDARMNELPPKSYRVPGDIKGDFPERQMRVPLEMRMKPNARVIICANNREAGYVNGSSGTLLEISRDDNKNPQALVRLDDGREVMVKQHTWENVSFEARGDPEQDTSDTNFGRRLRGTMTQLPLLPGWAITIHRSQGMSLQEAHINPRGSFEAGQIYVALSRVTSLEGLTLESPVLADHIITDPRVVEYHARILSNEQELEIGEPEIWV
ncbi:MAG: AAA family ATPase [Roseibium sp.]|uniref:ATP-dependent DNA helicase n=1 Tax=Roseibium sp. TaxID=1936156 RepID=UPI0032999491